MPSIGVVELLFLALVLAAIVIVVAAIVIVAYLAHARYLRCPAQHVEPAVADANIWSRLSGTPLGSCPDHDDDCDNRKERYKDGRDRDA